MADVFNQGLRESIAGILDGLAPLYCNQRGDGCAREFALFGGAETLRYAEWWEYGDPVPAAEHVQEVEAVEAQLADERESRNEAESALNERDKALRNLEKAIVKWDDDRDDLALIGAWDEYRAARGIKARKARRSR